MTRNSAVKVYSTSKFEKPVNLKPIKDYEPLFQTMNVVSTIREMRARRNAGVILTAFEEICESKFDHPI